VIPPSLFAVLLELDCIEPPPGVNRVNPLQRIHEPGAEQDEALNGWGNLLR
jgi:hypothetical protein